MKFDTHPCDDKPLACILFAVPIHKEAFTHAWPCVTATIALSDMVNLSVPSSKLGEECDLLFENCLSIAKPLTSEVAGLFRSVRGMRVGAFGI